MVDCWPNLLHDDDYERRVCRHTRVIYRVTRRGRKGLHIPTRRCADAHVEGVDGNAAPILRWQNVTTLPPPHSQPSKVQSRILVISFPIIAKNGVQPEIDECNSVSSRPIFGIRVFRTYSIFFAISPLRLWVISAQGRRFPSTNRKNYTLNAVSISAYRKCHHNSNIWIQDSWQNSAPEEKCGKKLKINRSVSHVAGLSQKNHSF